MINQPSKAENLNNIGILTRKFDDLVLETSDLEYSTLGLESVFLSKDSLVLAAAIKSKIALK
jgi:hypothetical protein